MIELIQQGHYTLTTFPFVCRYAVSNLSLSVMLSSSSDSSTLSKALPLATGDLGEVGLKRLLLKEPDCVDFPVRNISKVRKNNKMNTFKQTLAVYIQVIIKICSIIRHLP